MTRWKEEVLLLKEEMRRVQRFLEYRVAEWEGRCCEGGSSEVVAGQRAYTARQAGVHRDIAALFRAKWDTPMSQRMQAELLDLEIGLEDTFLA